MHSCVIIYSQKSNELTFTYVERKEKERKEGFVLFMLRFILVKYMQLSIQKIVKKGDKNA